MTIKKVSIIVILTITLLFGIMTDVSLAKDKSLLAKPLEIKIGDDLDVKVDLRMNDNNQLEGVITEKKSKNELKLNGAMGLNGPQLNVETLHKGKTTSKFNGTLEGDKITGNLNGTSSSITLPFSMGQMQGTIPLAGTAPQITQNNIDGTYLMRSGLLEGDLNIRKIDDNNAEIDILVLDEKAHVGEIKGTARIIQDKAVYNTNNCGLVISFDGQQAQIVQDLEKGSCDAGMNITFGGTYYKK